ncbi:N-acylneuraminate cytidylyltransferase [Gramella sp. Hel_I_59]|uniref:acylneuraminate cytidylyltransferase family protein n=1 Tax=Gramella sp. Hel_I_59 TaxID=1249978 RepID=UPI0011527EE7|nr:acylneuraminate cytidylyltransferase family protein [Gramella sp. Hel_I_59]TQI71532.1 N-acylneuraminate cytidylyltransferase [Gramella sp. Hel_I_59]
MKRKTKTLAIIPARGKSKRLKGKNLLCLGPDTLLEHSIKYALANRDIIDKIIVSTDDENIKKKALLYDVEVINRPEDLATDTATTADALLHVLESIDELFDNIILLQPTNPLRPGDLLKNSFKIFRKEQHDSLFTVSLNNQKFGKIDNGIFKPFNYVPGQRSQDLEPLFYENGLLYIARVDAVKKGDLISEKSFPYVVEHPFAQVDIDLQEDLDFADFLYKKYYE